MRYVPSGVPVEDLHIVWSRAWPYLEKAINRFPNVTEKFNEGEVLRRLFAKEFQLWICWDVDRNIPVGALTTEIITDEKHPGKTFLSIPLVGGDGWNTWGDALWSLIKAWGIEKGCTHALGYGRRGWTRLYGFVECGKTDCGLPKFVRTLVKR